MQKRNVQMQPSLVKCFVDITAPLFSGPLGVMEFLQAGHFCVRVWTLNSGTFSHSADDVFSPAG